MVALAVTCEPVSAGQISLVTGKRTGKISRFRIFGALAHAFAQQNQA
jgi:hypothetical protein